MTAIVNIVLPIFAIMLAGYLSGHFRLLGAESSEALNRFVYFGALPALFFVSLSRVGPEALNWNYIAAFGGGMALTFVFSVIVAAVVFRNSLGALGLHGLSGILANTGYMGIPLLTIAFGEEGKLPAIVATTMVGAIVMPVGVVIVELDRGRGASPLVILRHVLAAVARNPLVLSAAAGLAVSIAGLAVPRPVAAFCDFIGAAAGPCALFAIGLFMVGRSVRAGLGEVSWLIVLKLVVQPVVTWWLAYHLFAMPPVWAASAVILSATPTGTLVYVIAQQYGVYIERSTSAILLSTVVSVATLSAVFILLGVG